MADNETAMKEASALLGRKQKLLSEIAEAEINIAKTRGKIADVNKELLDTDAFKMGMLSPQEGMNWR